LIDSRSTGADVSSSKQIPFVPGKYAFLLPHHPSALRSLDR
jgi:hypothetical protein